MADGWPAAKVFDRSVCLGLDDIVFLPGAAASKASEVDVKVPFTRHVDLAMPIVGGARHRVVEESLAIALARLGSIGIIHRHQSIQSQAEMVQRVKQHEAGFILNPRTLTPRHSVADALRFRAEGACGCIPITENGKLGGKLLGIVTSRDLDVVEDRTALLGNVMTSDVVTVQQPVSLGKAQQTMETAKVSKLPVVNEDRELVALVCRSDLQRSQLHPMANRDPNRQLRVAASLCPAEDQSWQRAVALSEAGCDVFAVDSEDGVSDVTVDFMKRLKAHFPSVDVLAGRVRSVAQAKALTDAGADGLHVVVGDGAVGDEASTVYEMSRQNLPVPLVLDLEVKDETQLFKVLALSGRALCLNSLLARTREAGGDEVYRNGLWLKLRATETGQRQELPVQLGSVYDLVPHLLERVSANFKALGLKSLSEVAAELASGTLRLERQLRPSAPEAVDDHPRFLRCTTSALHSRW